MSTDKQQLEDKISNMEKELADMKKILATPELIINYWQPNESTPNYWYISPQRDVLCGSLNPRNDKLPRYRVFKTEAEASKYADYIKAEETLKKAIAEANEGWLPDWNNSEEPSSYVILRYPESSLQISAAYTIKTQPNFLYIKSNSLAQQLINKYQNEFLTYLSY